ncbi:hypothetical protein EXN66_Car016778 [Channa argus]|uniref:Uncharacterized protein n=1 Tax=Channa argus TaxID=215402 RepID=A0A6G1QEI3_CHAAH|nr:hypothetical protein EXN66_Car016778 [Channa argus]KAK2891907.1 hypothetical protein Q8A73_017572 [Channa argus]
MGSGTSRGKKVAPACLSEVKVSHTAASVTSPEQDNRPLKPLKINALLRDTRNRARPPDCHSGGHDSDFSGEDDDGEQDRAVADYEERERDSGKTHTPKKTSLKSKTYGLCHFSRDDAEDDFGSPRLRATGKAEEPRGSCCGSGDVNKRSSDVFTHFKKHASDFPAQQNSSAQGFLTSEASQEAVPTSETHTFLSSSLTTPVILYDGSDEELMDTIEREFS